MTITLPIPPRRTDRPTRRAEGLAAEFRRGCLLPGLIGLLLLLAALLCGRWP